MKTVKVKYHLTIGYANANREEEMTFDFPDDYTDQDIEKEIDADLEEWAGNYIETSWQIKERE